jgi:hypothetical protein
MNNHPDPSARGKKAAYYAFLVSPLIYIVLMFEMAYLIPWGGPFSIQRVILSLCSVRINHARSAKTGEEQHMAEAQVPGPFAAGILFPPTLQSQLSRLQ